MTKTQWKSTLKRANLAWDSSILDWEKLCFNFFVKKSFDSIFILQNRQAAGAIDHRATWT